MDIPVTFISASLAQAKVTVCRNDECHDWQLPPVPTSDQPEFPEYFPDAPFLTGYLSMNSDRSISLGIQWSVDNAAAGDGGAVDAGTLLQDGDHYVVTLTTSAGVTSTLLDKTATYQSVQPNGPDCPPLGDTYGGDPNGGCNACHIRCGTGNDYVCSPRLSLGSF